jgi:hypothetical protein
MSVGDLAGPGWRTLTELGMEVGLRPGEICGLHGHRVDWLRAQIQVIDVMTRLGLRQHPKSKKSYRVVPVPGRTLEGMSVLMAGRPRDALVFTAPKGGPLSDGHFRNRVWYPAVTAARCAATRPRSTLRSSGPGRGPYVSPRASPSPETAFEQVTSQPRPSGGRLSLFRPVSPRTSEPGGLRRNFRLTLTA